MRSPWKISRTLWSKDKDKDLWSEEKDKDKDSRSWLPDARIIKYHVQFLHKTTFGRNCIQWQKFYVHNVSSCQILRRSIQLTEL